MRNKKESSTQIIKNISPKSTWGNFDSSWRLKFVQNTSTEKLLKKYTQLGSTIRPTWMELYGPSTMLLIM